VKAFRSRRHARGFSLVETMTALAVFALLSGLLTTALWSARRMDRALATETVGSVPALRLNLVFASYIEAVAPAATPRGERSPPIFTGDASAIAFIAALEGDTDRSGLYDVLMGIERIDEPPAYRLIIERQRLDRAGRALGVRDRSVLFESAKPLRFSFVDERQEGAAGTGYVRALKTLSRWEQSSRLPRRVLLFQGAALIAEGRPRIDTDARCLVTDGIDRFERSECMLR
jgi:prepilin-type N-terminal cleavage/methylation domain-containing protein